MPARIGARVPPRRPRKRRGRQIWRLFKTFAVLALIIALAAAGTLYWYVGKHTRHVDALSGAADTPGTTYLIVGSDSREGWSHDGTLGARTDTIIVLHKPVEGPTALISIPRDSYVAIPGHGHNKINAAFAWGGPTLLVKTVEQLTGLTIDHYVEVGFGGVEDVVNAMGGVELCYDRTVNDKKSKLKWTKGCHEANGHTALAFARMRYADPLGDIGRTERQQQLMEAMAQKAGAPSRLLNPFRLMPLLNAGLDSFRVSTGTGTIDLARAALALKSARGDDAVTGTPPIKSLDYRVEGAGSTVLLDPDKVGEFWRKIAAGEYAPGTEVGGIH